MADASTVDMSVLERTSGGSDKMRQKRGRPSTVELIEEGEEEQPSGTSELRIPRKKRRHEETVKGVAAAGRGGPLSGKRLLTSLLF